MAVAPARPAPGDERPPLRGLSDYDYTNFYFAAARIRSGSSGLSANGGRTPSSSEATTSTDCPWGSAPATRVRIGDPKTRETLEGLINFASYNYLGLSYRPEVIEAICDGVRKYGAGASGSPVLSGTMDLHKRLATEMADFKGKDGALISRPDTAPTWGSSRGSCAPAI